MLAVPPPDEDSLGSRLSKGDSITETGDINAYDGGNGEERPSHDPYTSKEASKAPALGLNETSRAPASEANRIKESPAGSSTVQKSSVSSAATHQMPKPHVHQDRLFKPSLVSSAVADSESTRILCSVAVALVVVLSNFGFPGLGINIKKIITATEPLYLLLLANFTVMISQLLYGKNGGLNRAGKSLNQGGPARNSWADQVAMALEATLSLQKVVDSVFLDCSFYAVVLVCGLCLGNFFRL